jgi:hypothetical protein
VLPSELGDDSFYTYYHGTDGSSAASLLEGLNVSDASKNSNGSGALGFYLATTYNHANVYAEDRYPGIVLQYTINGIAHSGLLAAGANLRQASYGRGQEPGAALFIPPTAFSTFNSFFEIGKYYRCSTSIALN